MKLPSRLQSVLHSFRFRLTLWFVAILAVILVAFSLFIYFRQIQVLRTETTTRLTTQAGQFSKLYPTALPRPREHEEPHKAPSFDDPGGNFFLMQEHDVFALLDEEGQVIQISDHFSGEAATAIFERSQVQSRTSLSPIEYPLSENNNEPRDYLFLIAPVELEHDVHARLILGSSIDPGRQLPRLALTLAGVFIVTQLIAFGGGYWLANQAMHPVQTITRTARDLGEHDLNRRLNLNRTDELGELAATFDQMLDRLQAAFDRQRRFTADASHELRTPLTIIELEANRALERPRSSKQYQKTLLTIQSENEWMSRLVNELLTLARMDSGRAGLRIETLDLSEIVVEVVERLTPLAEEKGVALHTGALDEAPVQADRNYLTQLLTNLIENGIKYANGDVPRVAVGTGSEMREGKRWGWVRVSDNGPGISPEHLPHLFDRFYRADKARTRAEENTEAAASGSGLGLAIVQSITQAFGGTIDVQSKVGQGTIFIVWLPE